MTDLLDKLTQELKDISETPHLDALFFLESFKDKAPDNNQCADFINRRRQKEPVSKIIGKKGFWALEFNVSTDVLDPRPDSETLIESVLKYFPNKNQYLEVLDIGTGSGCLLLSLLFEYKKAKGIGVDISKEALNIANGNKENLPAEFIKKSFFDDDFIKGLSQFDIIVSNPPYIKRSDIIQLDEAVKNYDPLLALDGGEDGLDAYRAISKRIYPILKPNGMIFFEVGQRQEDDVIFLMEKEAFQFVEKIKDLGGIVRVLVFKKKDI